MMSGWQVLEKVDSSVVTSRNLNGLGNKTVFSYRTRFLYHKPSSSIEAKLMTTRKIPFGTILKIEIAMKLRSNRPKDSKEIFFCFLTKQATPLEVLSIRKTMYRGEQPKPPKKFTFEFGNWTLKNRRRTIKLNENPDTNKFTSAFVFLDNEVCVYHSQTDNAIVFDHAFADNDNLHIITLKNFYAVVTKSTHYVRDGEPAR